MISIKLYEAADRMVGNAGWIGKRAAEPGIATPAGTRLIHSKPKHLKWDREELKGLTYMHMVTNRGPQEEIWEDPE